MGTMSGEHDEQDGRGGRGSRTDGSASGAAGGRGRSEEDEARRRNRLLSALAVVLVISWLLMLAPLPLSLLSGVTALAGLVVLIPLVLTMFRTGRRSSALLMAFVGVPATFMIMISALMSALFYGPMHQLQECRDSALTVQAEAACEQEVQNSVVTWMEDLLGG